MGEPQAGGPDEVRHARCDRGLTGGGWTEKPKGAACCAPRVVFGGVAQSNAPSDGRVITAETITRSHAKTAWDAVRLTVPNVQLREVHGQPARIQRRGRASIYQEDQVRVMLDHLPVDDLQVLKQVAASDILTIEVLSGLDATTQYGGGSTTGVI